ncbi:hypothetical protein DERF_006242 [Dermatophagoides farinae]|uniref:Uncharacterized protein n=1 Tax=Dermatophagoides farinae TaxID=6954 RepID=A0A922I5V6_DERFA|nr:hypothetical protein DERF_006242 [Dermatophagoides farinae]
MILHGLNTDDSAISRFISYVVGELDVDDDVDDDDCDEFVDVVDFFANIHDPFDLDDGGGCCCCCGRCGE